MTKIKHEITDIRSSVNSTHIKLDELVNNSGQITVNQLTQLENGYNLDDYFPITNNEELKILNDKIQMDKELRLHLVSLCKKNILYYIINIILIVLLKLVLVYIFTGIKVIIACWYKRYWR